jgi:hypothetical protein
MSHFSPFRVPSVTDIDVVVEIVDMNVMMISIDSKQVAHIQLVDIYIYVYIHIYAVPLIVKSGFGSISC